MKRYGLPKSSLLRKTREFDRVYRNGKRLRGNGFSLLYLAGAQPHSRLGISVQRKTGNAVRRNRIKRIIRETFRLHREIFPRTSDIVFAVRPDFRLSGMQAVHTAVMGMSARWEQS